MLKSMLQVQDRIAAGDKAALPLQGHLQKLLIASIAENELTAPNIRAVVILSVIGGRSPTISGALRKIGQVGPVKDLALALDYYQSRKRNRALEKFSRVNIDELDSRIAPFIAFAQGNLNASIDPQRAINFFNKTRLLAPGTLLEEASLRKLMKLCIATQNPDQFMAIARQYTRRFIGSPYRSQYLKALMSGIGSMRQSISLEQIDELARMMPVSFAASYYQNIIRRSVIAGHLKLASHSINQLQKLRTENSLPVVNEQQLALFSIISRLQSGDPQTITRELAAVGIEGLSAKDRRLMDATRSMLKSITAPIDANILEVNPGQSAALEDSKKTVRKKQIKTEQTSSAPNSPAKPETMVEDAEVKSFVQSVDEDLAAIDRLLSE
ncbi:MAG: hypothetical protein ACR2PF_21150 [Rhizobiaceae bacterium]